MQPAYKILSQILELVLQRMPDADLPQYETALQEVGADIAPLNYLKKWK